MTQKVEAIKATHISVDCVPNDPVDVRCGGPPTLGFDFYIDADDDAEAMVEFIKEEMKKANKPVSGINIGGTELMEKAWTREMIADCIQKDEGVPTIGSVDYERSLRGYK